MDVQDLIDGYKEQPLLYISEPFSSQDLETPSVITGLASMTSLICFKKGWSVISAHKNCLGFEVDDEMSHERWMYALSSQIAKCDAVLLLPGWERSKGTLMEIEFCKRMDIPVYDLLKDGIPDVNNFGG